MRPFFITLIIAILCIQNIYAQSTSVFDANYFDGDNVQPPIKIGKGFHINDIYKQTRFCFTSESSNTSRLVSQQIGGKKTNIRVFYTKTNEEYNLFKSRGGSGKINYLNLFSLGGEKLNEYSNNKITDVERLIFIANVDFGPYLFDNDLILIPEAKSLIDQKNLQDFVKLYGTHYISGVRKESNITVILTKSSSKKSDDDRSFESLQAGGNIPFKGSGTFELTNYSSTNKFISNNDFSISVDINGPAIEHASLQKQIASILEGNDEKQADAIANIIESSVKEISDPNQGLITQYYYSPFSLYNLDGVYWDETKQSRLSKLNEEIIKVYSAKTKLEEILSDNALLDFEKDITSVATEMNISVSEKTLEDIRDKYNEILPNFLSLKVKADNYLKLLETRYKACSDVFCPNESECCINDLLIAEVMSYNFSKKIELEEKKIEDVLVNGVLEDNRLECEKNQQGTIIIENTSTNPYYIYNGDRLLEIMPGKSSKAYLVNIGEYNFKAIQKSGYMMYPTENRRKAIIKSICQEVVLRVGFED